MSWNGFKKAINRAGTQVMLKTGQIEQTVDTEYDFEEKRFKTMETASKNLHKELKHYLDSLRLLTNSQLTIAEVINSFYGEHIANDGISKLYLNTILEIQRESLMDLENPFNQTILNPISRFNSYFTEINEAIKKRANKKLDYDSLKNKVKKMIEKPSSGNDSGKIAAVQSNLIDTEKTFNHLNTQLKTELPQLISLRIPFLDPSFESFVKIQLRFFNENYYKLNNLQNLLDHNSRNDYINGKLDEEVDDVLIKMRELNITALDS